MPLLKYFLANLRYNKWSAFLDLKQDAITWDTTTSMVPCFKSRRYTADFSFLTVDDWEDCCLKCCIGLSESRLFYRGPGAFWFTFLFWPEEDPSPTTSGVLSGVSIQVAIWGMLLTVNDWEDCCVKCCIGLSLLICLPFLTRGGS